MEVAFQVHGQAAATSTCNIADPSVQPLSLILHIRAYYVAGQAAAALPGPLLPFVAGVSR